MKLALTTLLFRNPLVTTGIPVGLAPRALRHRLDELEMEATFNGDSADVTYASPLLADSQTLIECEFFAPWGDQQDPSGSAARHDAALRVLTTVMDRKMQLSGATGRDAIRLWSDLAVDQGLITLLQSRFQRLDVGVGADAWCRRVIGNGVLPAIIQRVLGEDVGMAPDVARALNHAPADLLRPSHEEFVTYLDPQVAREKLSDLPSHYIVRLVPKVHEIMVDLKSASPDLWRNTMSTLADSALYFARRQFNGGDARSAEQVMSQLLQVELPEADAIKAERQAANFRYR